MSLDLALTLRGDASSLEAAAKQGKAAINGVSASAQGAGAAADRMAAQLGGVETAASGAARQAAAVGAAQATATKAVAGGATAAAQATGSLRGYAATGKLAAWEIQQLSYQANDLFVQLASGQSPLTALIQQGSQVTPIFGGIRGTLTALGTGLARLATSALGVAAGIAAIGAGVGLAYSRYIGAEKDLEVANQGAARSLGLTGAGLKEITARAAEAGGVSVSAARDMTLAFVQTGKIGGSAIGGLIGISRQVADTLGTDIETATDRLAQAFADPVKGAQEFGRALGAVDAATLANIRSLVDQGRVTDAQALLLEKVKVRTQDAQSSATALGRAWRSAGREISDAIDGALGALDRLVDPTTADKLKALDGQIDRIRQGRTSTKLPVQPQLDALIAARNALAIQASEEARRGVLKQQSDAAAKASLAVQGIVDADPDRAARLKLQGDLDHLRAAQRNPTIAAGLAGGDLTTEIERREQAIRSLITTQDRAEASAQLAVRAATARTPAEKEALARDQKRLDLAGQTLTAAERQRQIDLAGAAARAQATQGITDQEAALSATAQANLAVAAAYGDSAAAGERAAAAREALTQTLNSGASAELRAKLILQERATAAAAEGAQQTAQLEAEAAAQKRANDRVAAGTATRGQAQQALQAEQQLRPLLIAQANAEGAAREALTRGIGAQTTALEALNAEQARAAGIDLIERQREDLAGLRLELDLIGQSDAAKARARAALAADQQIRQLGVAADGPQAEQIRANAAAAADLGIQLDHAGSVFNELGNAADQAADRIGATITAAATEGKLSLKSLGDVGKGIFSELIQEALKLAAINPLKNALGLGGGGLPVLGDILGQVGGSLFGGALLGGAGAGAPTIDAGTPSGFVPVAHRGWIVGQAANDEKAVSLDVFRNARRFHGGGLLPDEHAVVTRSGEGIFTPRQMDNADAVLRAALAAPKIEIKIVNNAGVAVSEPRETPDGQGGRSIEVVLDEANGSSLARPGSRSGQTLTNRFGARPVPVRR